LSIGTGLKIFCAISALVVLLFLEFELTSVNDPTIIKQDAIYKLVLVLGAIIALRENNKFLKV
jgi:uncharacterized membrane protein YbhN (UPF0104 family)